MVLNIAVEESRLFITAEKAPFLINIETFQPQELELHIHQTIKEKRPRAVAIMKQFVTVDQEDLLSKLNTQLSKPQIMADCLDDIDLFDNESRSSMMSQDYI